MKFWSLRRLKVLKSRSLRQKPSMADTPATSVILTGHLWEVVVAPGIEVGDDRRVHLTE